MNTRISPKKQEWIDQYRNKIYPAYHRLDQEYRKNYESRIWAAAKWNRPAFLSQGLIQ